MQDAAIRSTAQTLCYDLARADGKNDDNLVASFFFRPTPLQLPLGRCTRCHLLGMNCCMHSIAKVSATKESRYQPTQSSLRCAFPIPVVGAHGVSTFLDSAQSECGQVNVMCPGSR